MPAPRSNRRVPSVIDLARTSVRRNALAAADSSLLALSALVGSTVRGPDGARLGRLVDLVASWTTDPYPAITGLVASIAGRRAFIDIRAVADLDPVRGASLGSTLVDLRPFERRQAEVLLAGDVLDHQLVDVDGVQVIRANDLLVARVGTSIRLVGVDIGASTLLRRLGPRGLRSRRRHGPMLDWAVVQPLGSGGAVQVAVPNRELRRLRPAEIADLLEGLGRAARQDLLGSLGDEDAADALEELDAPDVVALLTELPPDRAGRLLAEMEPDEAVDALRTVPAGERARLLEATDAETATALRSLLGFSAASAGGVMTTVLVELEGHLTVHEARERLRAEQAHAADIDGVLVVDVDGRLLDDVSLFELLVADPGAHLLELVGEPWPITVETTTPLDTVIGALRDNRRSSVVVVDDGRPIGRILADDLLDAITPGQRRRALSRIPGS